MKKARWFLLVLMIVAAFLRLNNLNDRVTWFWGDCSRAVMVAKYIVEDNKWTLKVYPPATGINGNNFSVFHNSPVYYYVLAIVWWIFRSAESIFYFYAILSVLSVGLIFELGKRISNWKIALMIAILMVFSTQMIMTAWHLLQPVMTPFFLIILLLFGWMTYQKKSVFWLSGYFLILFLGINIHYSFLTILPIALVWGTYFYILVINYEKRFKVKMFIPIFVLVTCLGAWIYLSINGMGWGIKGMTLMSIGSSFQDWFENVATNVGSLFLDIFKIENKIIEIGIIGLFLVWGMYKIIRLNKKRDNFSKVYIFSWLFGLCLTGKFDDAFNRCYLLIYYPIIYLCIGLILDDIFNNIKKRDGQVLVMLLVSVIFISREMIFQRETSFWTLNKEYLEAKNISEQIRNDYVGLGEDMNSFGNNVLLWHMGDDTENYLYMTQSFWYFLEKYSNNLFQKMIVDDDNFQSLTGNPKYFYLVCSGTKGEYKTRCERDDFLFKRPDKKIVAFDLEASKKYIIYRFAGNKPRILESK